MIRLHVLYHQIVRPAPGKRRLHVGQPGRTEPPVHCVHHRRLFIQYHIRIVGHPVGHLVLSLEQIHLMVIDAHI